MNLEERLETFWNRPPAVARDAYIASTAVVVGDVTIGAASSVWYGAVLRGDINRICVGHHSNIQDNAVLHLSDDYPCMVGNYVTVGHAAILHACTVEDDCLIGMGSTVLDGAVIGKQSIVGANALVTQGTEIPEGSLVLGSPAKVVKPLSDKDRAGLRLWAEKYVANARYCLKKGIQVGGALNVSSETP
ncbi:MAG: gamma carbonic anhydrase family protein [Verrucomicrobiota bacterium]|jgi:gamma-carbonic anhydrase|nr:gamma carbonic anhydrase family protein [Verrucomicrobiota bacterium]